MVQNPNNVNTSNVSKQSILILLFLKRIPETGKPLPKFNKVGCKHQMN